MQTRLHKKPGFQGSLHSHVSVESLQNRKESKESGMEWKRREEMGLRDWRNHGGNDQ